MRKNFSKTAMAIFGTLFVFGSVSADDPVSFNRQIRSILASKCFPCHGPDESHRESDLRLDVREDAVDYTAIVPGEPEESLLVERIFATDDDIIMPPHESDLKLNNTERKLLKRWIAEGAPYDRHWAFAPPSNPDLPRAAVEHADWSRNEIDHFTLEKMIAAGESPAPAADKYTLVRRVYLDLIGLPPSIEEADAFVNSDDPLAYEKLVDELLDSPRYGEHWARAWLDLARYSDTNGYEKDRPRSIWPYRDWVIRALNADKPYDQFTIEQLAGDMLESPTADQIVATGFHRNTMLNEEGGIDPLEYRYLAMVDRVSTTGTVWMGLTIGCAQCHTHKYDPITHTDYYAFMALMDNTEEPDFSIPDEAKTRKQDKLQAKIAQLQSQLADQFPLITANEKSKTDAKAADPTEVVDETKEAKKTDATDSVQDATKSSNLNSNDADRRAEHLKTQRDQWIKTQRELSSVWNIIRPSEMKTNLPRLEVLDDGSIYSTGDVTKRDEFELIVAIDDSQLPVNAIRIEAIPDDRLPDRGPGRAFYEGRKGDFFLSEFNATFDEDKLEFSQASESSGKPGATTKHVFDGNGSTGWKPGDQKGERLQLVIKLKNPITKSGQLKMNMLFERHYAVSLGRFRIAVTANDSAAANQLPETVEKILAESSAEHWSNEQSAIVQQEFLLTTELLADARKPIDAIRKKIPRLTETLVMQQRPSDNLRTTHRHHRGEFLSPKETVSPAILEIFADQTPAAQRPTDRLDLAQWLVSDSNPLAARVAVNRAWRSFFGDGLVRTSGDFGVQSNPPTHPELLDWLAIQFIADGWSMKKLHRLIVNSATYRQSSLVSENKDSENRLHTHGPRFRMTGEMLRDANLKASGLLSQKMFGPGVRPPQPASVTQLAYGNPSWNASTGEDRYRRSIYTFSKRTASFAAYTVFDGPTGENCEARRNRSNTPLQALTILNDEMYLEMARALAKRTKQQDLENASQQLSFIFRSVLTRPPSESELESLIEFYESQKTRLQNGEMNVNEIAGIKLVPAVEEKTPMADSEAGKGDPKEKLETVELAGLAMVARVVMNLDESVMKQ